MKKIQTIAELIAKCETTGKKVFGYIEYTGVPEGANAYARGEAARSDILMAERMKNFPGSKRLTAVTIYPRKTSTPSVHYGAAGTVIQ